MTDISKLSKNEQEAILAKRAYYRNWSKKNKDKVKAYQKRYWEKKAQELLSAQSETTKK